MEITTAICAHYDDNKRQCLFDTRNWSEQANPRRCTDCPNRPRDWAPIAEESFRRAAHLPED